MEVSMNTINHQVRWAGTLHSIGGGIWFLLIVIGEILGISWDEPQTTTFSIAESVFIIIQTLPLVGFWAFGRAMASVAAHLASWPLG
jgi:hypothetical protein